MIALIPINIIKNGIRITTLSLLAIYVDHKFITDSFLHHSGGFLFYLPALGIWPHLNERTNLDNK